MLELDVAALVMFCFFLFLQEATMSFNHFHAHLVELLFLSEPSLLLHPGSVFWDSERDSPHTAFPGRTTLAAV